LLLQGSAFAVLRDAWIAITGADVSANVPVWRVVRVRAGETVRFPAVRSGVWIYLAVENGFVGTTLLGSASVYARGGLGKPLTKGEVLRRNFGKEFRLAEGVASRAVSPAEQRNYESPPSLRVWPAPQWDDFSEAHGGAFFGHEWNVTPQIDRTGYRLSGIPLEPGRTQIISEPGATGFSR
jgi:allophanate hydrolase subunit 2